MLLNLLFIFYLLLRFKVPPQIQTFSFGDEPANTGEMAGAFCMISKGDLPLEIRWTLNSAPVINGEQGFSLSRLNPRTSSLSIVSLEAHHRGTYKCIATNKAGTDEYSAMLEVNGLLGIFYEKYLYYFNFILIYFFYKYFCF